MYQSFDRGTGPRTVPTPSLFAGLFFALLFSFLFRLGNRQLIFGQPDQLAKPLLVFKLVLYQKTEFGPWIGRRFNYLADKRPACIGLQIDLDALLLILAAT